MPVDTRTAKRTVTVALVGNPNSGKTTLFNALTGLRQKIANYPGVTVETKTGHWEVDGADFRVIDLPGCYSLFPRSPDEAIACDLVLGRGPGPQPDAIICVADATNLGRHLYLVGQIIEVGRPVVVALTMVDQARKIGLSIDTAQLSDHLHIPVVEVVATEGVGLRALGESLLAAVTTDWTPPPRMYRLPPPLELRLKKYSPQADATELQTLFCVVGQHTQACTDKLERIAQRVREELGVDQDTVRRFLAEARYAWQRDVTRLVVRRDRQGSADWTRRLDNVLLHPFAGPVLLIAVLALIFQAVFSWSSAPTAAIEWVTSRLMPSLTNHVLAPGPLSSLINDGIFAGVGSVVTFLPQILLLFVFLTLLEDSGYLARAAFLLDRLMSKVGLSGRSFIPLLSSFACAIPGIMATRTIPHARDRLATVLVAPLMTCSARLVVYTLLIAAFVPNIDLWGPIRLPGAALFGLYLLGLLAAAGAAAVFRRTILRGPLPPLLLELPAYRRPHLKTLVISVYERAKLFLISAGTIIFAASIVLWVLFSYPRSSTVERLFAAERGALLLQPSSPERGEALADMEGRLAAERLRHSAAGYLGKAIEPVLKPLGFDWKIGVGILGSFAAREVFVSTMGVVYGVGSTSDDKGLVDRLKADRNPRTGQPVWTPLVALTLLVFYAFALQCISTIAVMRRETNGWKWPAFAFAYMSILACVAAFATRRIGEWLF